MRAIDPRQYGEGVAALVRAAAAEGRPRSLPFAAAAGDLRPPLERIADGSVGAAREPEAALALLWLLFDFMDESHTLVEDGGSQTASYVHGIIHRREPDPGNARYWFDRVGDHPIHAELSLDVGEIVRGAGSPKAVAPLLAGTRWVPARFVALVTGGTGGANREALLAIQRREWELLFEHAWMPAAR